MRKPAEGGALPTRRRLGGARQVLRLPAGLPRRGVPTTGHHARLFVVALLVVIVVGTALLALPGVTRDGESTPPIDAFFTAVSAVCVTGLVTVDTADHWNWAGQLVILLLIQVGGLGFAVGASLVLRALQREAPGLRESLILYDGAPTLSLREAVDLSRKIAVFTFAVEAVGALILAARFWRDLPLHEAAWHGLFHSVSAYCNASFDLQGGFVSLVPYRTSVVVNLTVAALVQAGALSYVVLADAAAKRSWSRLAFETKLVLLANAALVLGAACCFLAAEWSGALDDTPRWARPMSALFQSVAARSGGFATIGWGEANHFTLFVWSEVMFVGGASGSTAGGIRLNTLAVVVVALLATLRGQSEPQAFGRRIPTPLVFRAMAVMLLLFLAHFGATLLLAVAERTERGSPAFITLFFETMSALATDGVSTGITPLLSTAGKLVLCLTMIFGRIGPLTAVYALQHRQRRVRYRFPEEPIRIG
jgi:trk system potassium uptake protein TrkH